LFHDEEVLVAKRQGWGEALSMVAIDGFCFGVRMGDGHREGEK